MDVVRISTLRARRLPRPFPATRCLEDGASRAGERRRLQLHLEVFKKFELQYLMNAWREGGASNSDTA